MSALISLAAKKYIYLQESAVSIILEFVEKVVSDKVYGLFLQNVLTFSCQNVGKL